MKKVLNPGGRAYPGMSQGVSFGNLIVLAGQVAMNERGEMVGEGDIRKQAEQCFRNIELILAEAGGTLADMVELTCYLTKPEDARSYLELRSKMFPVNPPATTTVIAKLLDPRFLIEIKGMAISRWEIAEKACGFLG